jgi:hypothetical protein
MKLIIFKEKTKNSNFYRRRKETTFNNNTERGKKKGKVISIKRCLRRESKIDEAKSRGSSSFAPVPFSPLSYTLLLLTLTNGYTRKQI